MKIINAGLSFLLMMFPFTTLHSSTLDHEKGMSSHYQLLTSNEMKSVIGGLSVGQISIVNPANLRNVSNSGWVSYQVSYSDVTGADFVLFTSDPNGHMIELDRRNGIQNNGFINGNFRSSLITTTDNVLVAELISSGRADPYDTCRSDTTTIYARGMRRIQGNGR